MVKFRTANHRFKKLLAATAVLSVGLSGIAAAQADSEVSEYAALLQKNHDLQVEIAYMELRLAEQERIIGDLEDEIASIPALLASVRPLVENMVASYAEEFEIDPPFNASERFERLSRLQENLELGGVSEQNMLNRAIGMYEKEVNYGMTVEQYPGNHPLEDDAGWRLKACEDSLLNPQCNVTNEMKEAIKDKTGKSFADLDPQNETDAANMKLLVEKFRDERKLFDGNYLRVGRLALIYADVDGGEVYKFDITTKRGAGGDEASNGAGSEWLPVDGSDRINLFRAVKMAKGEAAPNVMSIPVLVE